MGFDARQLRGASSLRADRLEPETDGSRSSNMRRSTHELPSRPHLWQWREDRSEGTWVVLLRLKPVCAQSPGASAGKGIQEDPEKPKPVVNAHQTFEPESEDHYPLKR